MLLSSLNFYPFHSTGIANAQSGYEHVLFFDDFEGYAVGTFPSSGGWEIVWNGRGDEYQYISNLYSFSPTKSLHLWGETGWSCVVQRRFSSNAPVIGYEFAIFFNSRGAGYQDGPAFFKKGAEGQVWGTYYAAVIFDHQDGKIKAEDGTILGDWTPKTWYKVRVVLDRASKTYSVWINGELRGQNLKIKMEHPELIDAIALTSAWPGAEVYYDDVKVFEVLATTSYYLKVDFSSANVNGKTLSASDPTITVSPGSRITGYLEVIIDNNRGGAWITPVIGTASWKRGWYACISGDAPTGKSTQKFSFDLTAPNTPGTYYIGIFAGWMYSCDEVASNDHPAEFGDGDDVWDMPSQGWEEVIRNGVASTGPYHQQGRAIRIVVSQPPSQPQTGGAPPAVTGEPVIFIGSVEDVENGMLTLKVRKIVSGVSLQEGELINVFYNSTLASVLLGAVSKGDEVQAYGESSQGSVKNLSTVYGLVNLKYLRKDQVSKSFGLIKIYSSHTPLTFNAGGINIGFSFDTSSKLSLSMGLSGNYYGACRNNTTGLLGVAPIPGSGSFSLTISATVSVNDEYSKTFQKNWESSLDMSLGKASDITFERIPVPFDITVATIEVGITPVITFKPTDFVMLINSTGSLYFLKGTANLTASKWLMWSTHEYQEIPLIFKGDDESVIKASSVLVYEISLKVKLDATVKTLLGKKTFDLGTYTLDQDMGAKELEPKEAEIAEFQPYYLLTLQMPNSSMNASINQTIYNADEHGKIITLLKRGKYNVEVPKMKMIANEERLLFSNWNNSITDNILAITLTKDTFLLPIYQKQYYLHIISPVEISGEGWYNENTSVVLDITSKNATEQNGIRYLFVKWEGEGAGSYTGSSPKISITMKSPINETIVWKKQFKLTVIPTEHGTSEPQPGTYWVDTNSTVTLTAIPDQGYEAKQWKLDNITYEGSTLILKMDAPHIVEPIFSKVEVPPTSQPIKTTTTVTTGFQTTQGITETTGGNGSLTWALVVVVAVIAVVLVAFNMRKH